MNIFFGFILMFILFIIAVVFLLGMISPSLVKFKSRLSVFLKCGLASLVTFVMFAFVGINSSKPRQTFAYTPVTAVENSTQTTQQAQTQLVQNAPEEKVFVSKYKNGFVHPLEFSGSEPEKQAVLNYIQKTVKQQYSAIGMDNPSTLRMMEDENLERFKDLTRAENKELLDKAIKEYCKIGMCNYVTISMMYNEWLDKSKESLQW